MTTNTSTVQMTRERAFKLLKCEDGCRLEELKHSYHRLLLKWQPKRHNYSSEAFFRMMEVKEAYQYLTGWEEDDDEQVAFANQIAMGQTTYFRLKTGTGYMYFATNDDRQGAIARNQKYEGRARSPGRITDLDDEPGLPETVESKNEKARQLADELIEEELSSKKNAGKKKKKKQKQKVQGKSSAKPSQTSNGEDSDDDQFYSSDESPRPLSPSSHDNSQKNGESTCTAGKKQSVPTTSKYLVLNKKESNGKGGEPTTAQQQIIFNESSDEPGWDVNSAFFHKAASNAKLKSKAVTTNAKPQKEAEAIPQNVVDSRKLATQGNAVATRGDYTLAIELYNKAIALHNRDCKYFGNRSLCHEKLRHYEKALDDAKTAILLAPDWPKGYFRKGKALSGLKDLIGSEQAFAHVLKLEPSNFEAEKELHSLRLEQLLAMGFDRGRCEVALKKRGSVQEALDELLTGVLANASLQDVYVSDEEDDALIEEELRKAEAAESTNDVYSEVHCNALWVGNITQDINHSEMKEYFSQFGEIKNINIIYPSRCAFVNYIHPESARAALFAGDTIDVKDTTLIIRYPDRAFYHNGTSGDCVKGDTHAPRDRECRYWRRNGCNFGDRCRFLHVPENKGIENRF